MKTLMLWPLVMLFFMFWAARPWEEMPKEMLSDEAFISYSKIAKVVAIDCQHLPKMPYKEDAGAVELLSPAAALCEELE